MLKFFDRLKNASMVLTGRKSISASYYDRYFNTSNLDHTNTLNNSLQYLNAVETVSYVGRCVSTIAGDISAMEWEIVNKSSGKVVKNSRVADVLRTPYENISYSQLMFMLVAHMLLDGNAFLIPNALNDNFVNRLDNLFPVIPSDVDIISKSGQTVEAGDCETFTGIDHYRVTSDNIMRNIKQDEIFHFKTNCIKNIIRGMGEVQKNATTMEQDQVANTLSKQFFKKGVFSNILISPPSDMAPEQFSLWQELMNAKITGNKNWFDPLYTLPGGEIKTLSMSMKDMEMIEKQKFTKQAIASAFFLPDLIAGIDGSGKYDTAPEQLKIYYENTLPRFYRVMKQNINIIFNRYEPENEFRYIGTKYVDATKIAPVINSSFDRGIITRNDGRELLGLQRVDNPEMDKYYMMLSYVPAETIDIVQIDTTEQKEEQKQIKCNHDVKATEQQMQFHRASINIKQKIEKKMITFLNEYFKGFEKRVIKGLEKSFSSIETKSLNIDDMFDYNEEKKEMLKSARKMFTSAVTISISGLNNLLDTKVDSSFHNPNIPLVVEKLAIKYVDLTIDSRRDELKAIIKKSIDEGLTIHDTKVLIQQEFNSLTGRDGWKAIRIARTESTNAYHYSSYEAFSDLGAKFIDIVGCIDGVKPGYDCLKTGIPINQMLNLRFPPNHTGTAVISG